MDKSMRFLVVVPCFNRPELLDRCLASIAAQDDPAFDVIVANDASTDPLVAEVMADWCFVEGDHVGGGEWWQMHQSQNIGATLNIVEAIRSVVMDPNDVILIVDGDDRLCDDLALYRLREVYGGTSNLLSYGSYDTDPPDPGCPPAFKIPDWVLRAGCIRLMAYHDRMPWNHPISFRRRLFDALEDDDFKMGDEWLKYGYDVTFMAPMIELAGTRVEFVPEVLYTYTSDRPESVARAFPKETALEGEWVISQPRKYGPLP